jgi:4-hydroxy-tetrahydrodipicolinate reductase
MANAISRANGSHEIEVQSMRKGAVLGEHTAYFFSDYERLELCHKVADRRVFAEGALVAAQFLFGRPPGLYDMNDVLNLNLTIEK